MSQTKDWKLTFTCPACQRAGVVCGVDMASVMRCPHCRVKVVIDRSGMRPAPKVGNASKRKTAERRVVDTKRTQRKRVKGRDVRFNRHLAYSLAITALTLVGAAVAAAWTAHLPTSNSDHELRSAARAFQTAWLSNDLDAVRSYVLAEHQPRLDRWSAPRRAALLAGFGSDVQTKVTDVEVIHRTGADAEVRVAFEVRGRRQQVFQQWTSVNGEWNLVLPSESADHP